MVERRMIPFFTAQVSLKLAVFAALSAVAVVLVVAWPHAEGVRAQKSGETGRTEKSVAALVSAKATDSRKRATASTSAAAAASKAAPALRIINKGTVDDDPARLELAAVQPQEEQSAITADDDLDTPGTVADWFKADTDSYRTVCVRLCDGAITPISFATTRDRFKADARRCDQSCSSPSRLYVQRNPGTDAEQLVDLDGRAYGSLDTAFRFRTKYDAACTCRAHAWETLAKARHRLFAITERVSLARSMVQEKITELKVAAAKPGSPGIYLAARLTEQKRSMVASLAETRSPQSLRIERRIDRDTDNEADGEPVATNDADASVAARKPATTTTGRHVSAKKAAGLKAAKRTAAKSKAKPAAGAVLVFFNATIEGSAPPRRKSSYSRQADFSPSRRFDGTDWRMHAYEPL